MPTSLQDQIRDTDDGGTCFVETGEYTLDNTTAIDIQKNITIDFGRAVVKVPNTTSFTTGGFRIRLPDSPTGPINRVVIRNGRFEGVGATGANASNGPVIYADPTIQLDLLQIESCVFRNVSYGCNIDCTGAGGYIRSAIVCKNLFDGITKNSGVTTSIAARFALNGSNGLSYGNTFRTLKEYGIKVDAGGPFLSLGDSFFAQTNKDADAAALYMGCGSHVHVANGYFQGCVQGVKIVAESIDCRDASVSNCTFVDSGTWGRDIWLNQYMSGTKKIFKDITVQGTRHYLASGATAGDGANEAIHILSFQNMLIRDVNVYRNLEAPAMDDDGAINVFAYSQNETPDNLTIDGVRFRYAPVPTIVAGTRDDVFGLRFQANVVGITAATDPKVTVKNIDFVAAKQGSPTPSTILQQNSLFPIPGSPGGSITPYLSYNPNFYMPTGGYV